MSGAFKVTCDLYTGCVPFLRMPLAPSERPPFTRNQELRFPTRNLFQAHEANFSIRKLQAAGERVRSVGRVARRGRHP